MSRKPVSKEEKKRRLLSILHTSKGVFTLKEIEKLGGKQGIVTQTVKDVLQEIIDDQGGVELEKLGASNYYWSFPSKAFTTKESRIRAADEKCAGLKRKVEELDTTIGKLRETRVETPERAEKLRRYRELKDQNGVLQTQLDEMKMFDPALMKEVREGVERGCGLLVAGCGDGWSTLPSSQDCHCPAACLLIYTHTLLTYMPTL